MPKSKIITNKKKNRFKDTLKRYRLKLTLCTISQDIEIVTCKETKVYKRGSIFNFKCKLLFSLKNRIKKCRKTIGTNETDIPTNIFAIVSPRTEEPRLIKIIPISRNRYDRNNDDLEFRTFLKSKNAVVKHISSAMNGSTSCWREF